MHYIPILFAVSLVNIYFPSAPVSLDGIFPLAEVAGMSRQLSMLDKCLLSMRVVVFPKKIVLKGLVFVMTLWNGTWYEPQNCIRITGITHGEIFGTNEIFISVACWLK